MNKIIPLILSLFLITLISGCTQAGRIINQSSGSPSITGAMQVQPDETQAPTATENTSQVPTEPQNVTQPEACPETCNDRNNCTYDYCSGDTGYECVHAIRICPNSVETCPDGVKVGCKNMCINNSCTSCDPDCSEHQLPVCGLAQDDCSECEILNTETCECAQITACVHNDTCCPGACNYTNDNDCMKPACNESWECGNWSECINETQNKTCIDINSCNMTKRIEVQACEEEPRINHLLFSEVYYDAEGDDYQNEWFEIYNPTGETINLTGYSVLDNSQASKTWYFPNNTIIESDSYIVIARNATGFENLFGCFPFLNGWKFVLSNSGDMLSLKNPNLDETDFVAWEDIEGWDISANTGESIKREPIIQDTDSPDDWLSEQSPEPANC